MFKKPSPQTWLNRKFSTQKDKEKVKILFISVYQDGIYHLSSSQISEAERNSPNTFSFTEQNLTGDLDLSELTNLEKVWIKNQALNRIEISGCQKLKSFEFNNSSDSVVPKIIITLLKINDRFKTYETKEYAKNKKRIEI